MADTAKYPPGKYGNPPSVLLRDNLIDTPELDALWEERNRLQDGIRAAINDCIHIRNEYPTDEDICPLLLAVENRLRAALQGD